MKIGLPEWFSWDEFFLGLAFLGILMWRGIAFMRSLRVVDEVFKKKETIQDTQARHEKEIRELREHAERCNRMEVVFNAIGELADEAEMNEVDMPTKVIQALMRGAKQYKNGH